jgi:hypothetical protein
MLLVTDTEIDIVVVNWNSGAQLNSCIGSIKSFGTCYVTNTIVVDNGSTDGSAIAVNDIPNVKVFFAGKNLGFGNACNVGARHGTSDYLLFLNPDSALYSDSLTIALAFMRDPLNANVGICGVQLIDESGHLARSCARFPSVKGFVFHAIGIDKLIPKLGHFMAEWDHKDNREVDQVIGAFFLVRRAVFEALNGFDERFFVYFEEVDFARRAKNLGWHTMYLAEAQAFHAGGGTSNQVKAKRLFYLLRSRLLYSFKHFRFLGACAVLMSTLFIEPLTRTALALARFSWPALKETWVGYAMLWQWLPQWLFRGKTH